MHILYTISYRAPLIVIARGSPAERAYISRLIISRFAGSEIICENPLAIRIDRDRGVDYVIEYIESLRVEFDISVEKDRGFRCPDRTEGTSNPNRQRLWTLPPIAFKNMFLEKGEALARCMALNPFVRIASMAAPSLISTIGRFINDINMVLVGTAVSGGVFAIQSLGLRRASKKGGL